MRPYLLIRLGGRMFLVANLSLVFAGLLRGFDYGRIFLSDHSVKDLATVEQAAPLWAWAIALCVFSLLVLIGSIQPPRLHMLFIGHLGLSAIYAAIGTGMTWQAATDHIPGGWRMGTGLLFAVAVIHGIFAVAVQTTRQARKEWAREGGMNGAFAAG